VIVDNLPENFSLQKDNGIAIKSWFNDNNQDSEILKLQNVLSNLITLDDVREGIRKIRGMLSVQKVS
jgi:TFIIF-interacting CTD phosphatase-like protein